MYVVFVDILLQLCLIVNYYYVLNMKLMSTRCYPCHAIKYMIVINWLT